jgi:hypothetical protein
MQAGMRVLKRVVCLDCCCIAIFPMTHWTDNQIFCASFCHCALTLVLLEPSHLVLLEIQDRESVMRLHAARHVCVEKDCVLRLLLH